APMGHAGVVDRSLLLEGVLERVAGLARGLALEGAVLGDDVVAATLAGPLPGDRRPGIDADGRRREREVPAVALRADGHFDLLRSRLVDHLLEVVDAVEPARSAVYLRTGGPCRRADRSDADGRAAGGLQEPPSTALCRARVRCGSLHRDHFPS